jgi:hypothetical protein
LTTRRAEASLLSHPAALQVVLIAHRIPERAILSTDKQASASERPIKTGSPKNMVTQLQLGAEIVLQLLEMVPTGS